MEKVAVFDVMTDYQWCEQTSTGITAGATALMQLGQWIPGEQGQEEAQVKCIEQQQVRNLNLCLNIYYVRILMIENSDKGKR